PRRSTRASTSSATAVRTHVGDEADRTAVALEVDALVERLGDLHGPLRPEVQVAGAVLLELARRVGRGRVAPLLPPRDLGDLVAGGLEVGADGGRLLAVGDLGLVVARVGQPGDERRAALGEEGRADVPVLLGDE